MLRSLHSLLGFTISATDGDVGEVHDFLFDDTTWGIRYGVVTTGDWLVGRKVLLSPLSFSGPAWDLKKIRVDLSREKVKNSPDVDTDMPVSRQQRMLLDGYYGWSAALMPGGTSAPLIPTPIHEAEEAELAALKHVSDPHLRSVREVIGYHIEAGDGQVGHVEDFLVDDVQWSISYIIVDTGHWLPGRKVLVSPKWATGIRWDLRRVVLDLTRDTIRTGPAYDPAIPVDSDYEARLHRHYRGQDTHDNPRNHES